MAVMVALILYLTLHRSNRTHYTLPEIFSIPGKQISKIAFEKADGTVVLNKKDNTWYIGPKAYPADSDKIQDILNVIENLKVTALVSESKNYVRYDLNPDKKIHVKAWQGESLVREFDIGKPAATFQHTFVKLAENPNVYHARGDFRQKFDPTVEDLRDKTVLSFVQKDLREIKIIKDKKTVALHLKQVVEADGENKDPAAKTGKSSEPKPSWMDANGKKVDAVKVGRLLGFLNHMECEAYRASRRFGPWGCWLRTIGRRAGLRMIRRFCGAIPRLLRAAAPCPGPVRCFARALNSPLACDARRCTPRLAVWFICN